MIDKNLAAYKIPYGMYIAIGGDPEREFTSIADIYTEINKIYASVGNRLNIEPLKVEFTTNGTKVFNEDTITGYKPVEVSVSVDVGTAYEDGYNTGISDQKGKLESISITENGTYNREDGYNEVEVNVKGRLELSFEEIGYSSELKNDLNNYLNSKPLSDFEYSKSLYDKWDPSKDTTSNLYKGDTKLVYAPNIDTSNVTNMSNMFNNCSQLTTVPLFDTSKVTSTSYMFDGCTSLTTVPLFNTSNVTTMHYMFYDCSQLTTVPLFDTSKVAEMTYMFQNCTSLTTVPLFNTSNVTNMSNMFYNCSQLTTVPLFDTSKVTRITSIFSGCSSLTTIPTFDTSNIDSAGNMFYGCSSLVSLPLLDFSKVTSITYILGTSDLTKLTDIGGFKNLGAQKSLSITSSYNFNKAPNMTHDSAVNIINNLYDRKSAGYSVITLKFASKTLALLSDEEKAIATNKGWTLS